MEIFQSSAPEAIGKAQIEARLITQSVYILHSTAILVDTRVLAHPHLVDKTVESPKMAVGLSNRSRSVHLWMTCIFQSDDTLRRNEEIEAN